MHKLIQGFAFRFGMQYLAGENLPIQILLPLGGNNTLRGFSQDRFLDKVSALLNNEIRFPLYWRFGGIIGLDLGRVSNSLKEFNFSNWAFNPMVGLRFFMETFIVRLDLGFSKETTGIYFNFGHIY